MMTYWLLIAKYSIPKYPCPTITHH